MSSYQSVPTRRLGSEPSTRWEMGRWCKPATPPLSLSRLALLLGLIMSIVLERSEVAYAAPATHTRTAPTRTATQSLSWSANDGKRAGEVGLTYSFTHLSISESTTIAATITSTWLKTPSPSSDTTLSSSPSPSLTHWSSSLGKSESSLPTVTLPSVTVSAATRTHWLTFTATPSRRRAGQAGANQSIGDGGDPLSLSMSVSHPNVTGSPQPTPSSTVAGSQTHAPLTPTLSHTPNATISVVATVSPSGVYNWRRGRMEDVTHSATRSPTGGEAGGNMFTASATTTHTSSPVRSISHGSVTVSHSRSSSNFLPGVGINNPLLRFRPMYSYVTNPNNCSPSIILVFALPMVFLVMWFFLWMCAPCCCRDPTDVEFMKRFERVGSVRFMLAHHAYWSCVVPCHARCAPLHACELLSHMGTSLVFTIGIVVAVEGKTETSEADALPFVALIAIAVAGVVLSSLIRGVICKVGWIEGATRIVRSRAQGGKRRRRSQRGGIVAHGIYIGSSSSSDDDQEFPKEFGAKRKRHKTIEDFVAAYIANRSEFVDDEDGLPPYKPSSRDDDIDSDDGDGDDVAVSGLGTTDSNEEYDILAEAARDAQVRRRTSSFREDTRRPQHIAPPVQQDVVFSFDDMPDVEDWPMDAPVNAKMSEKPLEVKKSKGKRKKKQPAAPNKPPEWLFHTADDDAEDPDGSARVQDAFNRLPVRVPKAGVRRILKDDDEDYEWRSVPTGMNYVTLAVVLHLLLFLITFAGSMGLSLSWESRTSLRPTCNHVPSLLAIQFLLVDMCVCQVAYALWKGWVRGAWEFCCDIELDFGLGGRQGGSDANDAIVVQTRGASPREAVLDGKKFLQLHPRF